MEPNEDKVNIPEPDTNSAPVNLEAEVNKILNGSQQDHPPVKTKKPRDHAHEYQLKKKRRAKKKRTRSVNPKPKLSTGEKSSSGQDDQKKSYEDYKKDWENSLDEDAKDPSGPDALVKDEVNQIQALTGTQNPEKPRKYANSLVVLTNFILPAFCTIAVRIIGRGKKRPSSKDFMLSEADRAMLKEIADDGAGEEILSQLNPAVTYLLVMCAIGFNKVTDYWDSDSYEKVTAKMVELDQKLTEMTEKYNKLLEQNPTPENEAA